MRRTSLGTTTRTRSGRSWDRERNHGFSLSSPSRHHDRSGFFGHFPMPNRRMQTSCLRGSQPIPRRTVLSHAFLDEVKAILPGTPHGFADYPRPLQIGRAQKFCARNPRCLCYFCGCRRFSRFRQKSRLNRWAIKPGSLRQNRDALGFGGKDLALEIASCVMAPRQILPRFAPASVERRDYVRFQIEQRIAVARRRCVYCRWLVLRRASRPSFTPARSAEPATDSAAAHLKQQWFGML